MVQNPPCWRASYALGHPKQRKCKFVLMKSLCSGCPSGQLALQYGGFCTMSPLAAKGPLTLLEIYFKTTIRSVTHGISVWWTFLPIPGYNSARILSMLHHCLTMAVHLQITTALPTEKRRYFNSQ